jgi:hypothetical protein
MRHMVHLTAVAAGVLFFTEPLVCFIIHLVTSVILHAVDILL